VQTGFLREREFSIQGGLLLSTDIRLLLLLLLLPATACVLGAGEDTGFPTYNQGEASFPCLLTIPPVFSGTGIYGIVAAGDTLYHIELRHGRVHGKTAFNEEISALAAGTGSQAFAVSGNSLFRVDGFNAVDSCLLSFPAIDMSMCGDNPAVLLADGSIALFSGENLTLLGSCSPHSSGITCIQGFPEIVSAGCPDGTMLSFSVPSFSLLAEEKVNGSLVFMSNAGDETLIFSTDAWNEVAACSPADLKVSIMFTFPETPISAAADSAMSCIYGVCPVEGIQVCTANGEIAWKSTEFGRNPSVVLSSDCELALVGWNSSVTILAK
jgi:hypothetical protein